MEFISTQKNRQKIIREGYVYIFQKDLADDIRSYECQLRRKGQCKAKIKVNLLDEVVGLVNEHTHPPSQTTCEVAKVRSNMKRLAETTNDTPQQILANSLGGISEAAAVNMPRLEHIRRTIRHQRRDEPLPNPASRAAIPQLPAQFQETEDGERFLLFDSGVGDQNRILIFASPQGINLLGESENWFADGTFKVCPEIFFQVYTIHGMVGERVLPCIYGLLPNKTEATYQRFFEQVSAAVLRNGRAPVSILVDFERAAMNAIIAVFENVGLIGCFYHLASNIWKRIQNNGLAERYINNHEFALNLRMIPAIAFIPPDDVVDAFEQLSDEILNTPEYRDDTGPILDYFEDNYVGRFRRNAPRAAPLFPIEVWNMFHRTHEELPRTNNYIEGWHRRFQGLCSASHPTFWKFLVSLKKEHAVNRVEIVQALGGHPPPARRRQYVDCNARILEIVDQYPNRGTIQYLRSIAHNLGF